MACILLTGLLLDNAQALQQEKADGVWDTDNRHFKVVVLLFVTLHSILCHRAACLCGVKCYNVCCCSAQCRAFASAPGICIGLSEGRLCHSSSAAVHVVRCILVPSKSALIVQAPMLLSRRGLKQESPSPPPAGATSKGPLYNGMTAAYPYYFIHNSPTQPSETVRQTLAYIGS